MSDERANSAVANRQQQDVRDLLREIDSRSAALQRCWAEKRNVDRRKLQTSCRVHHFSPDGTAVVTTVGTTRDISLGGMGFVTNKHFARGRPVLVMIAVSDDNTKHLTGKVVYSRCIREGWYLTGIKFGPVDDTKLTASSPQKTADDALPADGPAGESGRETKTSSMEASRGARERALGVLAAAGAARNMSKQTIAKVVMMSISADHVVRRATIPVLMQITGPEGVMALIDRLNDANATVQGEAAEALGQLRATQAIGDLRKLLRHHDREVALRAAEALGRMDDKSGLRVAARQVHGDDPLNRRAARVLGTIVGQPFRATNEGVAAARRYVKANRIKWR